LYIDSSGTLKSSDGTNTATVTIIGGIARNDILTGIIETNAAGTQFRVGYIKNSETAVTYGTWATFVGSFSPLLYERVGYLNTIPMWFIAAQNWQRSGLTFAEITTPLVAA
jgi:hypothetical protein